MGRNIFQSEAPAAMLQAVSGLVHEGLSPAEAHEIFRELSLERVP
jgi:putative autoinducer-2 (AI-2) aldolase